jgi:hypothetical protein
LATHSSKQVLFEVESIVGVFLNDLENLDRLCDDLEMFVSRRIEKVRGLLLPLGRHRHLYGISAQLHGSRGKQLTGKNNNIVSSHDGLSIQEIPSPGIARARGFTKES